MSLSGVAKSTLAIIAAGDYLAPSGAQRSIAAPFAAAVAGTRLFVPDEAAALLAAGPASAEGAATRIAVTAETTTQAARRLTATGLRVVALNFASAKNPGGGFLGGAKAQEEDVCRCGALYPCLLEARAYYDANRAHPSLLYTDHIIYSPAVPFFRDDRLDLLEQPYLCSVITAPAPNAGEALRAGESRAAISAALHHRAALVLAIAEATSERNLILGAWGCGVFRNDPVEVAAIFAAHLASPRFRHAFDDVTFAIYDRSSSQSTLRAFEQRFA